MTIQEQRHADHDDDVITELSEEEFREAAYAALERLDLTYAQLRDMARRRDFCSAQAQSLWVSIGGALDL
jgi:pyrroloquinoline quinone (PQQ) biosynthesis protein C